MSTVTVRVLGVPELLARFARAAAIGEAAIQVGSASIAEDVAAIARERVPVDTGTLRDSITAEGNRVYTEVEYAPFVEYGTSTHSAQPFMRPAADTVDGGRAEVQMKGVMEAA